MTKEAFKFLLDCVIDVAGLAESYKHGKRNSETVFCNLVAAKIAHEKFGLTLMKIAEYLDNKPKRSALTLGLRNMNAHIQLFGGYYHMIVDKAYNVKELIKKVIDTYEEKKRLSVPNLANCEADKNGLYKTGSYRYGQ